MQSGKSSFNPSSWWNGTLFKKNLTRFWPIWGIYTFLWFLILPLTVLSDGRYTGRYTPVPFSVLNPYGLALAAVFGVLAAMAVFSYLYNPRSVSLMHTLPIRREGLFLTNYLSGLAFLLGPQVFIALLTLGAQALNRCVDGKQVFLWFLVQTLYVLFFYSFAVFCAMFTGNLLALPVFYGILNGLSVGMAVILNGLFAQFVYGFTSWGGLERAAIWFAPFVKLFGAVDTGYTQAGGDAPRVYFLNGVPVALLYALVGLVLAALALVVYRRRHLESAGDVVAVRWVRPVFKYGVTFCAAVALGSFLYDLFQSMVPRGMYFILVFLLLAGVIGYFTAEMLLKKSFKVFRKAWKGGAVFCVLLICAAVVMDLDLIGFNRVPSWESIQSVAVYGAYSRPDDSGRGGMVLESDEDVAAALALHKYAVDNRRIIQRELDAPHDRWENMELSGGGTLKLRLYDSTSLIFFYTLTDGSVIQRQYTIPIYQSDLANPASPTAILTGLINRNTYSSYFDGIPEDADPIELRLDVYNTETQTWDTVSVGDDDDRAAVLAAVRSDLAAGRIGRRFLFDDLERYETCYTSNLDFTFHKYFPEYENDPDHAPRQNWGISISLQTTASDTLAALEKLGVLDDTHILLNHVENQQRLARLDAAQAEADAGPVPADIEDKDDSFLVQGPRN